MPLHSFDISLLFQDDQRLASSHLKKSPGREIFQFCHFFVVETICEVRYLILAFWLFGIDFEKKKTGNKLVIDSSSETGTEGSAAGAGTNARSGLERPQDAELIIPAHLRVVSRLLVILVSGCAFDLLDGELIRARGIPSSIPWTPATTLHRYPGVGVYRQPPNQNQNDYPVSIRYKAVT